MTGRSANGAGGESAGDRPGPDARDGGDVDGPADDEDRSDAPANDGEAVEPADEPSLRAAEGVPDWEDEYVDRVADRLFVNYDLEKDYGVESERFDLYGELRIESSKHFLHPSVTYANHEAYEHLFVTRESRVSEDRLESLVDLGHDLADEWIDANEDHFSTTFTFVVVAPEIPDEIETFVEGFSERTLLKFGYNGEYKIRLAVAAPEREAFVSSPGAEIEPAFVHWETPEENAGGPLRRLAGRLGL
ncbi:hypothetical protein AB7C87_19610 [Natrarchaeobius sp. A-rgal3]|uniref:hypothetical protein n=1 Tax=Natrarchaeobius versutus TaxID=1679078 RepID=UPI0035107FAB